MKQYAGGSTGFVQLTFISVFFFFFYKQCVIICGNSILYFIYIYILELFHNKFLVFVIILFWYLWLWYGLSIWWRGGGAYDNSYLESRTGVTFIKR